MVDILKPSELPSAATVSGTDKLVVDQTGTVKNATAAQIVNAARPFATEAQAIAGTNNTATMTPLATYQAIQSDTTGSVALARAWASSDSDPNGPGTSSAKTYASKALTAAEVAEDWAESATPPDAGDLLSKSAKSWAGEAEDYSGVAKDWAIDDSNPQGGIYKSARSYALEAAALVADADQAIAVAGASKPFANRAAAAAADKVDGQTKFELFAPDGSILRYVEDEDATTPALTMNDGTKLVPDGDVYPDHFAENDGTDLSEAAQVAADYVGEGGTLRFVKGTTYRVDTPVTISHDNFTWDDAGATFDGSNLELNLVGNVPDPVVKVQGSNRASTTLASGALKDALTVTLTNASGMQVGDPIEFDRFVGATRWYTESGNEVQRYCVNKIAGISGNVVTLSWPLPLALEAGNPVHAWNTVKGFRATGGRYFGGGERLNPIGNGVGPAAFYLDYVEDCHINIGYIEGFQGFGMRFEHFMNCGAHGGSMRYLDEGAPVPVEGENSGGYGIFTTYGHGFRWDGTFGYRLRHMQDAGYAWNVDLDGLHAYKTFRPPFGSHSGCSQFTWRGCFSDTPAGGIQWRGHSFKAIGNTLIAETGDSACVYDSDGSASDIPKEIELIGNTFKGDRYSLQLSANIGSFISRGNVYSAADTTTNYAPVQISTLDLDHFSMLGDTVKASGASYCVLAANVTPRTRKFISILDCKLTGYANNPVRIYRAAAGTDVVYDRNRVDNSQPLVIDAVGSGVTDTGTNYAPGVSLPGGQSGTWTPVLTDGTNNATLSTAVGYWYQIGAIVTLNFRITVSSLGSATGSVKITGVPKTSINLPNYNSVQVLRKVNTNITAGYSCHAEIASNSSEIQLTLDDALGGSTQLQASEINTGTLQGQISYRTS